MSLAVERLIQRRNLHAEGSVKLTVASDEFANFVIWTYNLADVAF